MPESSSSLLLATVGTPHQPAEVTALTTRHHQQLKLALERHGAAVTVTDTAEYLATYPSPDQALQAAIAFQITADELLPDSPLRLTGRVVLTLWPAALKNKPADQARQILYAARAPCVLVTPAFAGVMPAAERTHLAPYARAHHSSVLRDVAELRWQDRAATYCESTRQVAVRPKELRYQAIKLSRRGKTVLVRAADCPFSIGRDTACALHLNGPNVSRLHGAILHEAAQFYYRDDSRNGSYLTIGGEEIYLHAERFQLVNKGVLSPGVTLVEQTGDVIRYQCLLDDPVLHLKDELA